MTGYCVVLVILCCVNDGILCCVIHGVLCCFNDWVLCIVTHIKGLLQNEYLASDIGLTVWTDGAGEASRGGTQCQYPEFNVWVVLILNWFDCVSLCPSLFPGEQMIM